MTASVPASVPRVLFGLRAPVDRRTYISAGLALFALKYAVDAALVFGISGELWSPLRYVVLPWERSLPGKVFADQSLIVVLAIWALPFAWSGISMTMRRCTDAGIAPGWGLLFFVPIVNYLTIATLCALPSRAAPSRLGLQPRLPDRSRALLTGSLAGVAVLILAMTFSVFALGVYGGALFVGAPFVSGFATAFVLARWNPGVRASEAIGVALLALLVGSSAFLVLAWEGLFCIAMAIPIGGVLATLGALIGRSVASSSFEWSPLLMLLACWPVLTGAEASTSGHLTEREVLSVLEVPTPRERVWSHVVEFSALPPPTEWFFRGGIAYPVRATIAGRGHGAVRRCEFSTGAFVEPITVWDAPRRLAFGVLSQPPPMTELSPYSRVLAPHLHGNLQSKRGEFRLIALAGGRTRIEARTWYTLAMEPVGYWRLWSDAIIHAIHMRVLRHIAREALSGEAEPQERSQP
jgi:uncharacterized membrane protein YhaH (DUF805 family)